MNSTLINECRKKLNPQKSYGSQEVAMVRLDKWSNFLKKFHSYFTSYAVQGDTTKFISNLKQFESERAIEVDYYNVEEFFNNFGKNEFQWDKYPLTDLQLEELNHILDLTLNWNKLEIKCTESDILVTGYCVSIKKLKGIKLFEGQCSHMRGKKFNSIKIFALNSIFIDESIDRLIFEDQKEMLPLIFMAPKWGLYNSPKIDLTGLDGDKYELEKKPSKFDLHGFPGLPGKPGGIFFGVVDQYEGHENLSIIANGGTGGRGEDGLKGKKGNDGRVPKVYENHRYCKYYCESGKLKGARVRPLYRNKRDIITAPQRFICELTENRDPGQRGGNGGDGGVGGKGGLAGLLNIVSLSNSSKIQIKTTDGATGMGGSGALGGPGGFDEFTVNCNRRSKNLQETLVKVPYKIGNGEKGRDNFNAHNISEPEKPILSFNKAIAVNEFKAYIRDNLINSFNQTQDLQFLKRLEEDPKIEKLYDALTLVDDFKKLEDQFYFLNNNLDFTPLYRSLRLRISTYSKNKNFEANPAEKEFFRRLYSAVLQKENNIKDPYGPTFITDIRTYLVNFKKNYIDPKNDTEFKLKIEKAVVSSNFEYISEIQTEMDKAKKQIQEQVQEESKKIQQEIEKEIEELKIGIKDLKFKAEDDYELLKKKEEDLEFQHSLKWIGNIIDLGCVIASGFGPVGMAAGLAVGTTKGVILSFNEEKFSKTATSLDDIITKLPKKVTDLKKSFGTTAETRLTGINELLDHAKKIIDSHPYPDLLDDFTKYIDQKKKEIENYNTKDKENFVKIFGLGEEVKKKYDTYLNAHEMPKSWADSKQYTTLKVDLEYASAIMSAGLKIINSDFDGYSKDKEEIDNKKSDNKKVVKKLSEIQDLVNLNLATELNKLHSDKISNLTNAVGTESVIDMDKIKRTIENALIAIKDVLNDNFSKLSLSEKLVRCIEKFQRLLPDLVKSNDYIISLTEKRKFADYMKDMSLATSGVLETSDPELDSSYKELEVKIYSNFILSQYEYFMNTFKQNTFPKTSFYLEKFEIADHLQLGNTISNLTTKVEKEISEILQQFDASQTQQISHLDNHEYHDKESDKKSEIFTWENKKYKNEIFQILSGEPVLIKADILENFENENIHQVMKFKLVDLYFKTKNETKQNEIDELMKQFEVSLTHQGDSYYLFNDNIYMIKSNTYQHNFIPFSTVLEKSEKKTTKDYTLSPYATWKIELGRNNKKYNFDNLKVYADEIDLILEGYGSWITPKSAQEWFFKAENSIAPYKVCDLISPSRQKRHLESEKISHRNKRNFKTESDSWFSWPSFNILPGADAVELDDRTSTPAIINDSAKYDFLAEENLPKGPEVNVIEHLSKNNADTFLPRDVGFNLNCGLLLVHYVLGKKYGIDGSGGKSLYLSPEQERILKVKNLSAEIVPNLEKMSPEMCKEKFLNEFAGQPEWYQNIFREEDVDSRCGEK